MGINHQKTMIVFDDIEHEIEKLHKFRGIDGIIKCNVNYKIFYKTWCGSYNTGLDGCQTRNHDQLP